jgi:hypothetical protein
MLDPERDPDASYHINTNPVKNPGLIDITIYPKTPGDVRSGLYRRDVLPRWMIEAMALLDAGHPEQVHDIGVRVGENSYWIEPVGAHSDVDTDESGW